MHHESRVRSTGPPELLGGPSPLWTRVCFPAAAWREVDSVDPGGATSTHRGGRVLHFPPGDRQADPREFLDHDLGESSTRQCRCWSRKHEGGTDESPRGDGIASSGRHASDHA